MFKGLLNNTDSGFHSYSTDDPACNNLGIVSFSKDAVNEFLSDESVENLAKQSFKCTHGNENIDEIKNKITGNENQTTSFYFLFNQETGSYEKKYYNKNLIELVDAHDASQKTDIVNDANNDKLKIVKDVQKSLHGCIHFYPFGDSGPLYKLHFQSRQKRNNSRDLAINGDPKISAVPRIPTGKKYHFGLTEEQKDKDNVGFYKVQNKSKFNIDQDDQLAKVAAKLRLSYNEGLGYFESGTQIILARLMEDISSASIQELDMDNIDNFEASDFYDPASINYTSGFQTGVAIPMISHGGNPHTFGPNIIDSVSLKKEKIRVVNRSGTAFKKNDVVVCMLINNEWILLDFGEQKLDPPGIKLGKWFFSKMIANSDAYCKDDRFIDFEEVVLQEGGGGELENVTNTNTDEVVTTNPYLLGVYQDSYVAQMREKFYRHLNDKYFDSLSSDGLNDIQKISMLNASFQSSIDNIDVDNVSFPETFSDFIPSSRYIQSPSFDLLGETVGGCNPVGNVIGRTNMYNGNSLENSKNAESISDLGLFWGPVFIDGYNSSQVLSIKGKSLPASYVGIPEFFGSAESLDVSNADSGVNVAVMGSMFDNKNDFNFYQLPADVALNASPSGLHGSPIESISFLSSIEQSSLDDFVNVYNTFRASFQRFSWIQKSETQDSFYDLEPINKNSLSFIPMSFSTAEDFYDAVAQLTVDASIFTGTFNREALFTNNDFIPTDLGFKPKETTITVYRDQDGNECDPSVDPLFDTVTGNKNCSPRSEVVSISNASDGRRDKVLPWDIHIKQKPGNNKGENHIRRFDDNDSRGEDYDGANLVAITAAKNTVKIGGGASVVFNTSYSFGLPSWTTVTGGQVTPPTILPLGLGGIAFGGGTNAIRTFGFPQWGNSDSSVDQFDATSLKATMYDHWPEEDTIYDVRYFAPLHFNPGLVGSSAETKVVDEGVEAETENTNKYQRSVDIITHATVDFRVPTYKDPLNDQIDNTIVAAGITVTKDGLTNGKLRPVEEWRVNTICRGMMISNLYGFRYYQRTIGLGDEYNIVEAGTGFSSGSTIDLKNGAKVKITEIDEQGSIISLEVSDRGEGFDASDFADLVTIETDDPDNQEEIYGYLATLSSVGENASIIFNNGLVYDKLKETNYPKRQGGVNCVPRSYGGDGVVFGSQSSTIGVDEPNSSNLYDIFLFCYNDVGHVDLVPQAQTAGLLQYINLDIGAG